MNGPVETEIHHQAPDEDPMARIINECNAKWAARGQTRKNFEACLKECRDRILDWASGEEGPYAGTPDDVMEEEIRDLAELLDKANDTLRELVLDGKPHGLWHIKEDQDE